ncbi:hypothetical protein [Rhizobium mongolense]
MYRDTAGRAKLRIDEMGQLVLSDHGGAKATGSIRRGIDGDPVVINFGKQRVCDGVAVHDNMIESVDMIEKAPPVSIASHIQSAQ